MRFVWLRLARHVRSIVVSVPVVQLATVAPLAKHRQGRAVRVSQVRSWGTPKVVAPVTCCSVNLPYDRNIQLTM